jgi:outer membrane protein assembly factor BamE
MPHFSLRQSDRPWGWRQALRLGMSLAACALATACGTVESTSQRVAGVVQPYRPQVVQGNFVSREQVEYLRPGITRDQVREVLGTPLATSVFHADRWDYAFTLRRQGVAPQAFRLSLFFKDDRLERLEGDTPPTEAEFADAVDKRQVGKVPVLEATEAQLSRFARPRAAAASAPGAPAAVSVGRYPPLEPASVPTPAPVPAR